MTSGIKVDRLRLRLRPQGVKRPDRTGLSNTNHHQVPLLRVKWFSQHYRHPGVDMKYLSHQRHTGLLAGRGWKKIFRPLTYIPMHKHLVVDSPPGYDQASPHLNLAQHLRNCASNRMPQGMLANYSGIEEIGNTQVTSHVGVPSWDSAAATHSSLHSYLFINAVFSPSNSILRLV